MISKHYIQQFCQVLYLLSPATILLEDYFTSTSNHLIKLLAGLEKWLKCKGVCPASQRSDTNTMVTKLLLPGQLGQGIWNSTDKGMILVTLSRYNTHCN